MGSRKFAANRDRMSALVQGQATGPGAIAALVRAFIIAVSLLLAGAPSFVSAAHAGELTITPTSGLSLTVVHGDTSAAASVDNPFVITNTSGNRIYYPVTFYFGTQGTPFFSYDNYPTVFPGTGDSSDTATIKITIPQSSFSLNAGTHAGAIDLGDAGRLSLGLIGAVPITLNITQGSTTTSVGSSSSTSTLGQSVTFTAQVDAVSPASGARTGTVTFMDGSTVLGTGSVNGAGRATYTTTALSQASHTITAVYGGDINFVGSTSSGITQTVKGATTTSVAASPSSPVFGQPVVFAATVAAVSPATGTPTGTVIFTIDGMAQPASTIAGGMATLSRSDLAVGTHTVSVAYGGDSSFVASSGSLNGGTTVAKGSTTSSVTSSPSSPVSGQPVTFTATVAVTSPAVGAPTGTVTFTIDGTAQPVSTLTSGTATLSRSDLTAGAHTVSVTYNGDGNFNTSTGSLSGGQTVAKGATTSSITASPTSTISGQSVIFTATIAATSPATGTPTGTVTFTVDGTAQPAATLSGGTATLSRSDLTVGAHTVSVTYNGDASFNTSTGSLSGGTTVAKGSTTSSVTSSPASPVSGQPVTFTATVAATSPATGTPTGTVTFTIDGTAQPASTLSSGSATLSRSDLTVGAHTVSVAYNGDASFLTSTGSLSGGTTIAKGTTTSSVTASPASTVSGQSISFTATVAATSPATGTPTGTVTFTIDGTAQPASTLSSGSATLSRSDLTVGAHTVSVAYNGDASFLTSTGSLNGGATVAKGTTTSSVTASSGSPVSGQPVTFTATVAATSPATGTPTGTVTFSIDGAAQPASTLVNGIATLSRSDLAAGAHTVTVSYPGDGSFLASTGSLSGGTTVSKGTTTSSITASPGSPVSGQPVTFTATVAAVSPATGIPTGTVTFTVDGAAQPASTLVNGTAALSRSDLAVGAHTVTASYSGDGSFNTSTGSLGGGTTVSKGSTTSAVTASPASTMSGQSVTFTATVAAVSPATGMPTGTVTFSIDGTAQPASTLSNGTATLSRSDLTVGAHAVTVSYSGDSSFLASTGSLSGGTTVSKGSTTSAVTASPASSVFGQPVTFTATVTVTAPATGTPTGTVIFTIDGAAQPASTLSSGTATLSRSDLTAGTHTVTASYSGDGNFNTSTGSLSGGKTVSKGSTTSAVTASPASPVSGQPITFTATVAATAPATGTPTGTVIFTIDGTTQPASTLTNGTATLSRSDLTAGTHTVTASYSGDGNFTPSTGSLGGGTAFSKGSTTSSVTASTGSPVSGQPVTFTATVTATAPATGTPTGTVIFTIDGTAQPASTLVSGTATLSRSDLTVGAHTVSVAYNGDGNFNTSTASLSGGTTVAKGGSATALVASSMSATSGQSITFTATVSATAPATGTPTGTVTFKDGGTALGTGTLASGVATYTTSALTSGSHSITAVYNGDASFTASTSAAIGTTVTKAATTSLLVSSVNPSNSGDPVTLTATVSTTAGTPTGTVTFSDGASSIGTATLTAGTATFTTSALAAGGHTLTASYGGDASYATSVSPAVTQTVILGCTDSFGLATALSGVSGTVTGSTAAAGGEPGEPDHAGGSAPLNSVWCRWTAPGTGPTRVDTTGSDFDTTLAIYTGTSFGALAPVASNDNISVSVKQSRLSFDATQGTQYLIAIDGAGAATGHYVMTWSQASAAPTLMAAVLPASRSVVTGTPATAFATIINSGSVAATQCSLALPSGFPGTFSYQTTTTTNTPLGSADATVDIPAGAAQGFVFGITPTVDLSSTEVAILFDCTNTAPVNTVPGLNTLNLSSSALPTPDLIMIGATLSGNGIVDVPVGGATVYAAAAINIGSAASLVAVVDDNGSNLPLALTLCRSDPVTSACTSATSASVATTIATNEVATFTIFVQATGVVPFDPANSRLFLRLETPDGVARGATTVAVRTQ